MASPNSHGLNALAVSNGSGNTAMGFGALRFEQHRPRQHRFGRWSRHTSLWRSTVISRFKVVLAEEICDGRFPAF